ncbi:MAG: hypothetical protein ACJ740_18135 [Gaiellales bacterium]|jgi:hypothetical protein
MEQDREADAGERRSEYTGGDWQEPGDPLAQARSQAVDENSDHQLNQPPGMDHENEAWQREKQALGQNADEPGLPRTWREGEGPHRRRGAGDKMDAGRDERTVPAGSNRGEMDDRQHPGTDTGTDTMGRPLSEDEIPDTRDVTQG